IVSDKKQLDFKDVQRETLKWQNTNYYSFGREWAYKGLPRTIVAEELVLTDSGDIPKDYKFFCFNGTVKLIQVDYDRFGEQKRNLFDRQFNPINGRLLYPRYSGQTEKPANLRRAVEIAETLSADFNFIRVDLYLMGNKIYF